MFKVKYILIIFFITYKLQTTTSAETSVTNTSTTNSNENTSTTNSTENTSTTNSTENTNTTNSTENTSTLNSTENNNIENSSNELVCGKNLSSDLEINNDLNLCIHFLPIKEKVVYKLQLDNVSLINIKGGYEYLVNKSEDIEIVFQIEGDKKNYLTLPYKTKNNIFDVISIVIGYIDGNFKSIITDYGCWGCKKEECVDVSLKNIYNTNQLKDIKSCGKPLCTSDFEKCDLKILVYYVGTDKKGRHLISAGERLKNFKNYSIEEMITRIRNFKTEFKNI